jgi:hypothetical protein
MTQEKLTPNPTSSPGLEPIVVFACVTFPLISQKVINFDLGPPLCLLPIFRAAENTCWTAFGVMAFIYVIPSAKQTATVMVLFLYRAFVSELQKPCLPRIEPSIVFGIVVFVSIISLKHIWFCTSLSCLVSELQEPPLPSIRLITLFQNFDPPLLSSRSQGISMPRLAQIHKL